MTKNKPKLLLIAGYFPPVRISSGSIRPWNLAKELVKLGWEVTVVTPKISIWDEKNLDDVENTKVLIQQNKIKMIYTGHFLKCLAPWRYKLPEGRLFWFFGGIFRVITRRLSIQNWVGWVPSALHSCRYLTPNDVDIIIATGAPFWGFEIAYQLSKRLKVPFIMDYRDLWTDNPWNRVKTKWVIAHENKLLKKSSAVTIVSPLSGQILGKKYNILEKIHTITNGFDQEEFDRISKIELDHFTLIYAGSFIPPKLSIDPIISVLLKLKQSKKENINWKFHYFGPNSNYVSRLIINHNLVDIFIDHGNIPRQKLLPYLQGGDLNLVLSANEKKQTIEELGVIPGKIFELIGMKAKILSIVPANSAIEKVLESVGVTSFSHDQTEEIAQFIQKCMENNTQQVENIDQYSWRILAGKFDSLLKDTIEY